VVFLTHVQIGYFFTGCSNEKTKDSMSVMDQTPK
jgi:hypothetical protein